MQTQFWHYWICRCITELLRMIMILTPPFCIVLAKGRPCFIISFTRAVAASTTLIRSMVSFNCKESSVRKNIQFECTLALTILDSSCLSPPSPDHWSWGLRATMNIVYGLGLRVVYNLCTTPRVTYYSKSEDLVWDLK
jgi:hypothetical protein